MPFASVVQSRFFVSANELLARLSSIATSKVWRVVCNRRIFAAIVVECDEKHFAAGDVPEQQKLTLVILNPQFHADESRRG